MKPTHSTLPAEEIHRHAERTSVTAAACPAHRLQQPLSWRPTDMRRWALAGLGMVCVGLGTLGAFVPGLPTTIFVIIAAWSFAKSCPWLEDKMLRNKLLGPSMEIIDGSRPFTRKARMTAMGMMFLFGFSSIAFLYLTGAVPYYVLGIIFLALLVGAVSIIRFKPRSART
jgi:uncharacterized membrane protein YbaN (DUF454 family)